MKRLEEMTPAERDELVAIKKSVHDLLERIRQQDHKFEGRMLIRVEAYLKAARAELTDITLLTGW